jgi:hypothetical protein
MKPPANKQSFAPLFWGILLILVVVVLIAVIFQSSRRSALQPIPAPAAQSRKTATNLPAGPVVAKVAQSPVPKPVVMSNYRDFKVRPLPVAYESSNFQWTLADGKDTNVIRQLAHNRLEYDRMVDENSRIFRRQLVYLKDTAAAVFEQAKLTGQPVRQLTLPGLDGQELQFQIVTSEGNGSSRQGMFSGHLVGNTDSMVTLAFMDGREAFTILSPKENLFVVGEPREAGQVIVKAIDPNTYGVGPPEQQGDDFIRTDSTQK